MRGLKYIMAAFSLSGLLLSGCSTVTNPYHSDFSCPSYYHGKCTSLNNAYNESIHNTDGNPKIKEANEVNKQLKNLSINSIGFRDNTTEIAPYKQDLFNKMKKLIKHPKTPVVVPPNTMRVLILPYVNSQNELEMGRYVYFFADKPKWIFNY